MLKDPQLKQIIINAVIITVSVFILLSTFIVIFTFAIIIFPKAIHAFQIAVHWYSSLLAGWCLGAFASIGVFFLKGWVMKSFFDRNTTKRKAFMASMFHTFGYFLIFAICLLSLLAINYASIGKKFFIDHAPTSVVNSPINLFTFIAGIHVIMISIFLSHFIRNRKLKKEKLHINIQP